MSSPIGSGGTYTPGSPEDQATRAKAAQQSQDVIGSIGGAVGKATLGALGIKAGFWDQLLNTSFYSICAIAGIAATIIGMWMISKEVPGVGGVSSVVGGLASKATKLLGVAAL